MKYLKKYPLLTMFAVLFIAVNIGGFIADNMDNEFWQTFTAAATFILMVAIVWTLTYYYNRTKE